MRIALATGNADKVRELSDLLTGAEVRGAPEGFDVDETGSTLMQNAGLPEYYRRYLMGHSPGRAAIVSYTHLNELRDHYESAAEKRLAPIVAAIQSRLSILDIGL